MVDGEFLPDLLDKLFKLGKFSNSEVDVVIGLTLTKEQSPLEQEI